MKIKANDGSNSTIVRTYTFTKSVNGFTIQNTSPYTSDTARLASKSLSLEYSG